MRLVLVTETFPPEVNGVARTLGCWVDAFRRRGHEVMVIRPCQHAEGPGPGRVAGLRLPFYPELRCGLASPFRVRSLLNRAWPDLVHVATEGPLGCAAVLACRALGLPVATSFHTNFDHYIDHYGLGALRTPVRAYLRWLHNLAGATLVPTASTARRLTELGFRNVAVWSRGVDSTAFHPRHRDPALRQSLGLKPDDPLLLYVGRLAAEKNLDALLTAYARLCQEGEARARLALVGDGPLTPALRARAIPGLIFAGMQTGEALTRWYASADIFAFPSRSETFGNVVLEAMASGLPIVGFDCPGVQDQVTHGMDGLLVADEASLTEGLVTLCANVEQRRQLGRAARCKAESRNWDVVFDDLERRYLNLLSTIPTTRREVLRSLPAPPRVRGRALLGGQVQMP